MNINRLIRPRSVAVVGATERPSIGRDVIRSLGTAGFDGPVYPVNPKYETVLEHRCFPDLESIDGDIDLVVVCLGHRQVLAQLEFAAQAGAGAAVIYGSGYAESGEEGRRLQANIQGLCIEAGIALCGPNCMGISSPHARCHSYMFPLTEPETFKGNVGLVSQSGSICIGLSIDVRRYGFSHLISSGNEAVISSAAFLEYLVADAETKVIALFSESVNEPDRFVAALDAAAVAGKPVVALKVGKSARAAAAVSTHTGGLAGASRVYSAALRAHRAIEVETVEELVEVLSACQVQPLPADERLGIVTASGGLAELMLDVAEQRGVELPPLAPYLREEVTAVVGTVAGDGNPLDAWGNGDYTTNYDAAFKAFGRSENHGSVLYAMDGADGQPISHGSIPRDVARIMRAAKAASGKPTYLLSTVRGVFPTRYVEWFGDGGVGILSGIAEAMTALTKLAAYNKPPTPQRLPGPGLDPARIDTLRARPTIHEHDAKAILSDAGLPIPEEQVVTTLAEAQSAARAIGYPIALKALSDELAHRTEGGLVRLNVRDGEMLESEWRDLMQARPSGDSKASGSVCLVQSMVPVGIEVIVGVSRDPDYGHVLVVGPGGVLAEVLDAVSLRMLPLREGDARAMIEETRLSVLLDGIRGAPAADRKALIAAIESVADFAAANTAWVDGIDVNPLIVDSMGCVAVDALIVPRARVDADST